jgi:hypothetical protein
MGAAGGAELVATHLGKEISKRKPPRFDEAFGVVLLGAASKRHSHATADVAHAVFGERLKDGVEGGLLHGTWER